MRTYFVTRHPGARDWAGRHGVNAIFVEHLDPATLRRGDTVIGTLPAQLIADIARRGCRYVHLAIDIPSDWRGRDLSADDMERMNARLEEIALRGAGPYPRRPTRIERATAGLNRRWRIYLGRFRQFLLVSRLRVDAAIALALLVALAIPASIVTVLDWAWNIAGIAGAIVAIILCGAFYLAAFFMISVVARTVVWSRLRAVPERESQCRVLVMGLSEEKVPLYPNTLDSVSRLFAAKGWATDGGYPAFVLERIGSVFAGNAAVYAQTKHQYRASREIADEATLIALEIRWQQNIRAMAHHGESLEAVLVLPSKESLLQWAEFEALVRKLFGEGRLIVEMIVAREGDERDYENYAYVWSGLSRGVDRAHELFPDESIGLADDEICIDVTAGQKTFSMAGANVTLNRELKLSYVNNDGKVTVYNAEIDTADALRRVFNAGGAGL